MDVGAAASVKSEYSRQNPEAFGDKIARIDGDKNLSREEKLKKLKESAKDFESIFVNNLLKVMRSTIQKTNLISGGNAENIYQGMLDEEYSKIIVKRSDFGFAKQIYEQYSKTIK